MEDFKYDRVTVRKEGVRKRKKGVKRRDRIGRKGSECGSTDY